MPKSIPVCAGKICLVIGILGAASGARAAVLPEAGGVWLDAVTSTHTVYVGDPFRFVLTAGAKNAAVRLPGPHVIFPGCRLVKYSEEDVSQRHEGYTARQGKYLLVAFALERVIMPAQKVFFSWPDGTTRTAVSQPVTVRVLSLEPAENFELQKPRPMKAANPWWPYAVLLASAAGLVLVWRRRPRPKRAAAVSPPHVEAFAGLEALGKSRTVAEGRIDHYYTDLSRILRRYLARRYRFPALENPRAEIIRHLADAGLGPEPLAVIDGLLEQADLVKFAKAEVDFPKIAEAQKKARQFILDTLQRPETKAREDRRRV